MEGKELIEQTKKEAYKKDAVAFEALLGELNVTSKSKWSEFEQVIQEKYQSKVKIHSMR